jgi:hypothetical protein
MSEPIYDAQDAAIADLAEQRHQLKAEVARLRTVLAESNAVCVCGCPDDAHENYGEDGEACPREDHECIRTNRAVLQIVARLTAQLAASQARVRDIEAIEKLL